MLVSDFDYKLPKNLIAQKPAEPRESARLMVLNHTKDRIDHRKIEQLTEYLNTGDVMVINTTKVFRARLIGKVKGKKAELFLVKTTGDRTPYPHWQALAKPGKHFTPGTRFTVADGFAAKVVKKDPDGTVIVDFGLPKEEVIKLADRHGKVPLPPYIKADKNAEDYQTVYAAKTGSVAAPTAGFHLTKSMITKLKKKGVQFLEVTLHVGLGTFLPVRTRTIDEHQMHSEWVEIPETTALEILKAKVEKRRVVAVGTTTLRALEGAVERCGGEICSWHGDVDLFITPGYKFKVVDALLTNFHLPKSTLLMLVSAFAGRQQILRAYNEAVKHKYRFFSFGDAMLIQ